jgi:RHS repeat-associated protein
MPGHGGWPWSHGWSSRGCLARVLVTLVSGLLVWTSLTVAPQTALAAQIGNPAQASLPQASGPSLPSTIAAAPPAPILPGTGSQAAATDVAVRPSYPPSNGHLPSVPTELPSLRTEHSRTIANPDGSFSLEISGGRMNYLGGAGAYEPVDLSLVNDLAGPFDLRVKGLDRVVRFGQSNADTDVAQIAVGPYVVSLRSFGYGASTSRSGSQLGYAGAPGNGTLTVQPTDTGFEWGVTIPDASSAPNYHFALDLGMLTARVAEDGQSIILENPTGDWSEGMPAPSIVGVISAPSLLDGAGQPADPSTVQVQLITPSTSSLPDDVPAADQASLSSHQIILDYHIRPTWLHDGSRIFPVSLDPSVCVSNGVSGCASNAFDYFIESGLPDTYPTGWNVTRVGYDTRGWGYAAMRGLQYFPDVALPDGAQVTAATLALRIGSEYGPAPRTPTMAAYRVTGSWTEGTETWHQFGSGGNYTSSNASPSLSIPAAGATMSFDVSKIVRQFYTRRGADWVTNIGFLLKESSESSSYGDIEFDRYNDSTTSYRPKLTINYALPAVSFAFDPTLGANYSPSTMKAGQTIKLPVTTTNTTNTFPDSAHPSSQGYAPITFNHSAGADGWYYELAWRWFDAKGNLVACPGTCTVTFASDIAAGGNLSQVLSVTAPGVPGQYTLRLDLGHVDSSHGNALLYASDWATPSLYYARDKRTGTTADDTRWVGSSVIERDDFSISVTDGSGTNVGDLKTVTLGDGSSLGINLATQNVHYGGVGGVGFSDLLPLGISYGYDKTEANACNTSSYNGLLGACGWYLNYDERFTDTGANTYTYQGSSGNNYFVSTDSDGQLQSGAPNLLERTRITWFDENSTTTGLSEVVTAASQGISAYSGSYVLKVGSDKNYAVGSVPRVNLLSYPMVRFGTRTTAATGDGLAFQVRNYTRDGGASYTWYVLTAGTNFTSGFTQKALGGSSLVGNWQTFSDNLLADVISAGLGSAGDDIEITGVNTVGNKTAGSEFFDALRFEAESNSPITDSPPSWSSGNSLYIGTSSDKVQGTSSLQVDAGSISSSPTCNTSGGCATAYDLNKDAWATWSWKKAGGSSVAVQFKVTDARTSSTGTITYYAGSEPAGVPHTCGAGSDPCAVQIDTRVPVDWATVTRNLAEDARQLLGFYNETPNGSDPSSPPASGPVPDPVSFAGYTLSAVDGNFALFDWLHIDSAPNRGSTGSDEYAHPSTAGDGTFTYDLVATYANGEQHFFNRDGLLTEIRDRDGNKITFDYALNTALGTQLAYTLTTIHAPSDATTSGGNTYDRQIDLTKGTPSGFNQYTFTEKLGTTGSPVTGRRMDFYVATGTGSTWGIGDLVKVSPARNNSSTCASEPNGCVEFTYNNTTSHTLAYVADPRWDGSTSGANDYRFQVVYSGSSPYPPYEIVDRSHGSTPVLYVASYDTGGSSNYARALYQTAAERAPGASGYGYATYVDLSPEGHELTTYVPKSCGSPGCTFGSTGSYPSAPTSAQVASQSYFDGLAQVNETITYRCNTDSGTRPAGCTSSTALAEVTRQQTLAGAKVDNYADPLRAAEVAWTQTNDQFVQSLIGSSGANEDLYQTSYAYDSQHQVTDVTDNAYSRTASHWQPVPVTTHTVYDSEEHPIQVADEFLLNGGFEDGLTSWSHDTGPSAHLVNAADAYTRSSTSFGSAYTPNGHYVRQEIQLVPGQTFRFQVSGRTDGTANATAALNIEYYDTGSATYVNLPGQPVTVAGSGTWADVAYDVTVPLKNANGSENLDGRVQIVLSGAGGAGGAYWDNASLVISWAQTAYNANGTVSDTYTLKPAGGSVSPATIRTHLAYAGSSAMPPVLPTTTTADYINGVYDPAHPDEDLATSTTYDTWGRVLSTTDPDGVTASTAYAASNKTDPISTTDGLGNTTTYTYDRVGNRLSTTAPLGETSSVTFDQLNHPLLQTAADGTQTLNAYNNYGQLTSSTADYVSGVTATPSSPVNLVTAYAYDPWGRAISTVGDSGTFAGAINAQTEATYDLLGNLITSTPHTGNRLLNSGFEASGSAATDWSVNANWAVSSAAARSGSNSLHAVDAGAAVTYGQTYRLPLSGGARYTFSAWVRGVATNAATANIYLRVRFYQADGTYSDSTAVNVTTIGTSTTWQQLSGTVTAPVGAVEGYPFFGFDSSSPVAGDEVYIDDTSLDELRDTTSYFQTQTDSQGSASSNPLYGLTFSRSVASGSRGPIAQTLTSSGLACPGSTGTYCNTVSTLDFHDRANSALDAYAKTAVSDYDLNGHLVRSIANYVSGGSHGSNNDQNLTTTTAYDVLGRPSVVTDAANRATTSDRDLAGRVTAVSSYDSNGVAVAVTKTVYTGGGRVDRTSLPDSPSLADGSRTWTKYTYDADGRQVLAQAHYDLNGYAGISLADFESGSTAGWGTGSNWLLNSGASIGTDDNFATTAAENGSGRLRITTTSAAQYEGAAWVVPGTFQSGHTYQVRAYVIGWSTHLYQLCFGHLASGTYACSGQHTFTGSGTTLTFTWTPSANYTDATFVYRSEDNPAAALNMYLDDLVISDTTAGWTATNVPAETVYDADGRTVETVSPPRTASSPPVVTATAFDLAGRSVMTSANATDAYSHKIAADGLSDGLVSYWPLDERSGSSAADKKGSNTGTYSGGYQLGVAGGPDDPRSSVELNGSSGQVSVPDASSLDMGSTFSLEFWARSDVRLDANTTGNWKGGIYKGSSYGIGWEATDHGWQFEFYDAGLNHYATVAANTPVQPGQWYYVVGTFDGTTMKLYIDGALAASTNIGSGHTPGNSTSALSIGNMSGYWAGSLDEVAVYNQALSSGTIGGHQAAGRPTAADASLTTRTTYDALGRATDTSDALGRVSHQTFDRLGDILTNVGNYTGRTPVSATDDHDVASSFAYDALGDQVGSCPAQQVFANACNPAPAYGQTTAWHYAFDAAGNQAQQVAPVNTTLTGLLSRSTFYDAGGRLTTLCDVGFGTNASCAGSPTRHTDFTYDGAGRTLTTRVYSGGGTGNLQQSWTKAYNLDGSLASVAFDGSGAGEGSDTLTYTYDAAGRPDQTKRGSTVLTDDGWNADGTLASRADGSVGTTTFGYDWAKRQTSVDSPLAASNATFSYNLDGTLASRSWSGSSHIDYTYDAVGRALTEDNNNGNWTGLYQAYDRAGNVVEYDYNVGSTPVPGVDSGQNQYFSYDGLNRLVQENLGSSATSCGSAGATCYTYDLDGNRLTKNDGGVTTTWTYDRTDETISSTTAGETKTFTYSATGDLTTGWTTSTTPAGTSGSVNAQVSSSYDDMYAYNDGGSGSYSRTSTHVFAADSSASAYDYASGLRFTGLAIPQGATITAASITLTADATASTLPSTSLAGEATDNASGFGGDTYATFNARTRTSASVSWTPTAWSSGTSYTSPDISSVVQEVVNRSGWASGNALDIIWSDATSGWGGSNDRLSAYSYDGSAGNAATLHVEYTTAGGSDTTAPSTPANLSATANGTGRIDLSWSAASDNVGVVRYRILRDGNPLSEVDGSTTTFSDYSVAPGTSYSYTVTALDAAGNASSASGAANATAGGGSTGSLDLQVAGSSQDMYAYYTAPGTGTSARTTANNFAGDHTSTAYDYASGLHFGNVTIPAGAVITAARLGFTANATQTSIPTTLISGEAADNATDFASDTFTSFNARSRTTASVAWTPAAWSSGSSYQSADLSTVIGEITGRSGWSSGNALNLFWSDATSGWGGSDNRLSAYSYDGSSSDAPTLHIEYSLNGGPTSDTTAPSTPAGLSAGAFGSHEIDLAWTASTDNLAVQGYRVYRDGVLIATTASAAYADTGLATGSSHTYTVAAVDGAGNASPQSGSAGATTSSSGSTGSADAAVASSYGDMYAYYTAPGTGTSSRTSTHVFAGDSSSTTYDYTSGLHFGGLSVPAGSTITSAALTLTSDASASAYDATLVTGEAADNAGDFTSDTFTTFNARTRTSASVSWTPTAWTSGTSYTSPDISSVVQEVVNRSGWASGNALNLFWGEDPANAGWGGTNDRLSAYSYDGSSSNAASLHVEYAYTDTSAPSTPANLSATANGTDRIDLSWSASTDDVGVVRYQVSRDGNPLSEVDGSTTSFSDYSVAPGTSYSYTVSALDGAGNASSASGAANATTDSAADTTAPSVPTNLAATANGQHQIDLAWTASTDNLAVQGYRIYRDSALLATTAGTAYADTGLDPGTSHTYTVAAIDGAGNASAQSSSANATSDPASAYGQSAYTYDASDHLVGLTSPSAAVTSFGLDALGRTNASTTGGVTTAIGYAGAGQTAWQLSRPGATTSAILDAGGSRLGLSDGSTQSWLIDDLHGSPVASYSADGSSITGATRYDAYGLRLGSYPAATSPDPWGYQDRLALSPDPAHPLYDFAARSYDPGLGTFTSLDSLQADPANPLSLNRFLYAGGNPTSYVDPSGHLVLAGATTDQSGSLATSTVLSQNPETVYSGTGYTTPAPSGTTPTPSAPGPTSPAAYNNPAPGPAPCVTGQPGCSALPARVVPSPSLGSLIAALADNAQLSLRLQIYCMLNPDECRPDPSDPLVAIQFVLMTVGAEATAPVDAQASVLQEARVFWSGEGSEVAASAWARSVPGAITIAQTQEGAHALAQTAGMDWFAARPIWANASREFATGARGAVHVFQSAYGVARQGIWATVEYPALVENADVTEIIYHVVLEDGRIVQIP